ncbi:hypothetical protein VTO73DRAFT_599 [Trametes versicolor]
MHQHIVGALQELEPQFLFLGGSELLGPHSQLGQAQSELLDWVEHLTSAG